MTKYLVHVKRVVIDTYEVDAKNSYDAAGKAGVIIHMGDPPSSTVELSRSSAKPVKADAPAREDTFIAFPDRKLVGTLEMAPEGTVLDPDVLDHLGLDASEREEPKLTPPNPTKAKR